MKFPFTRYVFFLLFAMAYTGFLILEKQWFSKDGSWTSFLPTFLVHFFLLVVFVNAMILIPFLLVRKKRILYIINLIALIGLFTFLRSVYHRYINHVLFNSPIEYSINDDDWGNFVYGIWFTVVSSMLYVTQKWYDQKQQGEKYPGQPVTNGIEIPACPGKSAFFVQRPEYYLRIY
ncbi:MAG: hypothetical protein WDO19_09295 [Bacteroidota bacterium]